MAMKSTATVIQDIDETLALQRDKEYNRFM